jgi:anti-sigma B factor antagonist
MALKLTNLEIDGVTVLDLDGRIVLGEETSKLRESVKNLVSQGKKKLVLDMKNVTMIDSSGLGALVAAYSSAKSAGASLRLCNLGAHFNQLLQITKLLTVFEVSKTQEEAIRSFSKAQGSGV